VDNLLIRSLCTPNGLLVRQLRKEITMGVL